MNFLKTLSGPIAIAVEPNSISAIRSLRSLNIFPTKPVGSSQLIHSLVEARAAAFITNDTDIGKLVQNCLGIPFLPIGNFASGENSKGGIILEGRTLGSSVLRAALIEPAAWEKQIENNRSLLSVNAFLSLGRNWLLDQESFVNDSSDFPETVFVDNESIGDLADQIQVGKICLEKLCKIIFDIPFIDELPNLDSLKDIAPNVNVSLRYSVPELGPFAHLIESTGWDPASVSLKPLPGFSISVSNNVLQVHHEALFKYIGRDEGFENPFRTSILTETPAVVKEPLRRKRTIMQPDWRVRKVPIATYHKKRGAKGQIYITTKHKGWTFYKSRY